MVGGASSRWPGLVIALAAVALLVPGAGTALVQVECLGQVATITGTPAGEPINGSPGDDVINGLGGNDVILGGGGNDIICGDLGSDLIALENVLKGADLEAELVR